MDKVREVEAIRKIRKVRLRLRKRLTMKGLYYREMIKRIQNPKVKNKDNEGESYKKPLTEEGNILDKLC